jgi:hypothetical protein
MMVCGIAMVSVHLIFFGKSCGDGMGSMILMLCQLLITECFCCALPIFLFSCSMDDGSERMYYVGQQGRDTAIGVAKLELDADTWVREQSSIVFAEF